MAKAAQGDKDGKGGRRLVAENRKARFQYEVLDTIEAGIVLVGTEVKSLRQGQMSLEEAHGRVFGEDLYLVDAHIPEYSHGNVQNHAPTRKRKLLVKRREFLRLKARVAEKGLTLVPLEVYFGARGFAKVKLGVCKGRKLHDKRAKLKDRDDRRAIDEG